MKRWVVIAIAFLSDALCLLFRVESPTMAMVGHFSLYFSNDAACMDGKCNPFLLVSVCSD